jgi:Glycosyl transferase family 2
MKLSVVVPAVNTLVDVTGCLEALEKQRKEVELEALVVDRIGAGDSVRRLFSWARVLPVKESTTIPEMRAIAFQEATGEAIAVIEDHVIVPPKWATRMLGVIGEGRPIVGGAVENAATGTLIDWAAFFCEYSHCIPPIEGGSVTWLTGNNVVYTKALIDEHREVVEAGKWENHLHNTLRAEGVELFCQPDIVVGHKKHYTFREYMSQRYLYSRSYAGARVAGGPALHRVTYGLGALALPPILFYRTVSRMVSKRKHLRTLAKSLPLIMLFVTSWGAGEAVGYFFGPGDSLSKVC